MNNLGMVDIPVKVTDVAIWWCITNEFVVLAKFHELQDAMKFVEKWPAGGFVWNSRTHKCVA